MEIRPITTEELNKCSEIGGHIAINRRDSSIMFIHREKKDLLDKVREYCRLNIGDGFNIYSSILVIESEVSVKETTPIDYIAPIITHPKEIKDEIQSADIQG